MYVYIYIYIYIIKTRETLKLSLVSKNKRDPKIEPCFTLCTIFLNEDIYLYCAKFLCSSWVISTNFEWFDK